ncbi:MAG: hypothetical protein AB2L14_09115 [Candidatus Xenobiia bacterium LiM19]
MAELHKPSEHEDIIIITNSPGELTSWVRSTTEALRHSKPDTRIVVALVPCPYATGREQEIARSYPDVDLVLSPSDYLKICLGFRVKSYTPSRKGIVLFLGGDFWHALLMARRLKYPALAYAVRSSGWNRYFELLFVIDDRTREIFVKSGIPDRKIEVVGNLMMDGIKARLSRDEALSLWGLSPRKHTVGIFPGSRVTTARESLPVFLKVVEELSEQLGNVQFLLSLSPFIHVEEIEGFIKNPSCRGIESSSGVVNERESHWEIVTRQGATIHLMKDCQYDLINASDLILTIPGTNTAEIAALGKPMIVSFSWRAKIPRGGLGFFLNFLPTEWPLRRAIMHKAYQRIKYKALPNQWADREIVPEVKVEEKACEITAVALTLLNDSERREKISRELLSILGSHGAADRIAQRIASLC